MILALYRSGLGFKFMKSCFQVNTSAFILARSILGKPFRFCSFSAIPCIFNDVAPVNFDLPRVGLRRLGHHRAFVGLPRRVVKLAGAKNCLNKSQKNRCEQKSFLHFRARFVLRQHVATKTGEEQILFQESRMETI